MVGYRYVLGGSTYTRSQLVRSCVEGPGSMQKIQEFPLFFKLDSTKCAVCKMGEDVLQLLAIQFVVEIEYDVKGMFAARVHSTACFLTESQVRTAGESNVRSLDRALARRDITVPAGHSNIVAISW